MQEVIIKEEGEWVEEEGPSVDSNYVCKEIAVEECAPAFNFTHTHLVQANVLGPTWHSGLKNTALQASMWISKLLLLKTKGFPPQKTASVSFFLLAENPWVSPPPLRLLGINSVSGQGQAYLVLDISWSQDRILQVPEEESTWVTELTG